MAEPTAHTESPGGHGAFPPFQAQHFPSQLLWLVVSFVLLYALMSRIALPRIAAIFAERSKRIADDLAAAQRFKEQSEAADAAYQKALAEALNRAIQRNPREVFLIEGYTDAVGSDVDNLSLSDRRAESMAVALTEQFQVPAENLSTQGYGKQFLKVPASGPERANRRVAIRRITPLVDPDAVSQR